VFSVFGVENPLMDIIAHVESGFPERFGKRPGAMHLVDYGEVEALLGAVSASRRTPGGSAANTTRGVAALNRALAAAGAFCDVEPPVFNGAVGRDETGDDFELSMERAGVVASLVRKTLPTGVSLILVTPDGERTMNTHLGACREFQPADLDLARLASSRVLYLTGYLWDTDNQRNAAEAAVEHARGEGRRMVVAFDLADPFAVRRYGDAFRSWIPRAVDVLFGNRDELAILTGGACDEDCVTAAAGLAPVVVMKIGERGCIVGWEGRSLHVPGVRVRALDTTGAGDAFAAGFLHGRIRGLGPAACAEVANRVAACVVASEGCLYDSLDGDSVSVSE
jgi:sugar/nucleoside kinase (ribokinase family)